MNRKEIRFIISLGESFNLEFKEDFSPDISREICAFANANGGKIILGVRDDGEIKNPNRSKLHGIFNLKKGFESQQSCGV